MPGDPENPVMAGRLDARDRSGRAGRALAVALAALVLGSVAPGVAAAPADTHPHGRVFAPGLQYQAAATSPPAGTLGTAVAAVGTFTAPPNTDFVLDFAGSVDVATRQVVTAAAGVWSALLDTRVPIVVDVRMEPLAAGLLGAAGPTTAHFGRPSFPERDVLYPVALANQFAGRDLDPGLADIDLLLSSSMRWDKRVDGLVSPTLQSMLSVTIHELGHGLGHTSWVRPSATGWEVNYLVDGVSVALAYDRLVATGRGSPISSVPESDLGRFLTAPLYWTGSRGAAAAGGIGPRLYSPPVFEPGSSVGHLDEATFGTAIMTPFLAHGESHTAVPDLTRAMLADTGWSITAAGSTTTTTTTPTGSTTRSPSTAPAPSTLAGTAEAFVDAVSRDFLGRPASDAERSRWRDHLRSGGSRDAVTAAFANSDEWVGVIVDGLYRSTLGRGPDAGGRAHWIRVIRAGATPAEVASQFYSSDEYFRRSGGTASAWVGDLYAQVLGRQADAGGLAHWVARSRTVPRAAIAFDFYQSLESRRDRVEDLFRRLLGRAPDDDGWAYWSGILSNGRDVDLAVFLAASDEYFRRAASRT